MSLYRRVARVLDADDAASAERIVSDEPDVPVLRAHDAGYLEVRVEPDDDGSVVTVVAADRVGLMSDVSGAMALMRLSVRAVRAWTLDTVALSRWHLADTVVDQPLLVDRFAAVRAGRVDVAARLTGSRTGPEHTLPPSVLVHYDASEAATVLEVRTADSPGVVHLVCRALARLDLSVRSAHVATFGPQSRDIFYVTEQGAAQLSDERAATASRAVRKALTQRQ